MLTLTLRNGITRAEGYPAPIKGYPGVVFIVHNSDWRGEPCDRWVVSELTTGRRVTINDYPTDTAAIQAAQDTLDREWSIKRLWRALEIHRMA